jgi:hypothetical protein
LLLLLLLLVGALLCCCWNVCSSKNLLNTHARVYYYCNWAAASVYVHLSRPVQSDKRPFPTFSLSLSLCVLHSIIAIYVREGNKGSSVVNERYGSSCFEHWRSLSHLHTQQLAADWFLFFFFFFFWLCNVRFFEVMRSLKKKKEKQ